MTQIDVHTSDHLMRGTASPLGATPSLDGVNFCVYSKHATGVELLLFDRVDDAKATHAIRIDPTINRSYHYWHVLVPGVTAGQIYGYRLDGPWDPTTGMRFDSSRVLLDPYGRGVVVPDRYSRLAAAAPGDNGATAMKSVVVDSAGYDWEGDTPPQQPSARTIVYEMHVRGFTCHPSSGVGEKTRGTFAGLIEKIPYLQQLGITAVELLPVFQFDAQACPPGKVNYWGYRPVSFFAPHQAYSSRRDPLGLLTSSATWSKHCIARGSKSSSTSFSTIPRKAAMMGRRYASAAWRMLPTTSSTRTAPATPTTRAAATPSTPTIQSSAG
jgi:glycogen operon protein